MKNELRIGFMGTPDFAVPSLEALLHHGYAVPVVVTAPDRPAGRGRKLKSSPVKQFAQDHNIPVLQPERLKDPAFAEELRQYGVNLLVVVAFRMLPKEIWALPEHGTFNLHASLLPDYRGAAPINWAVINGETTTGVTTFFIDEKIDTGNILLQESTEIGPGETAGDLHDRLMNLGAKLVVDTVDWIASGQAMAIPQKQAEPAKHAPKLGRENTRISWGAGRMSIFNKIRGLNPYPAAWTELENHGTVSLLKVYRAEFSDLTQPGIPGQIKVLGRQWHVCTPDGWLELLEIQLPGKRRMAVGDVLNGLELDKNARLL
jgi:methionyl-tRNA formyltransferase